MLRAYWRVSEEVTETNLEINKTTEEDAEKINERTEQ
jgi:hypothetical protein